MFIYNKMFLHFVLALIPWLILHNHLGIGAAQIWMLLDIFSNDWRNS